MVRPLARGLVLALYGPTSAGKTALSVDLALRLQDEHRRPVVILNADSRQVYRYLDIGTSKTRPDEMRGVAHELLDITEPAGKLELEDYVGLARGRIEVHLEAGAVPFVVGGTGVYVKALLEGWQVSSDDGGVRDGLRRDFPPSMRRDAFEMLRRLDKGAANKVHQNNYVAVINALATVMSRDAAAAAPAGPRIRPLLLGLDPDQAGLDQRVASTYDDQVRRGLFDEVLALTERYDLDEAIRQPFEGHPNQVLHTHGYREYFEVAAARGIPVAELTAGDLGAVRSSVVEHIRGYTRRQKSWFKKLPRARVVRSVDEAQRSVNAGGRQR